MVNAVEWNFEIGPWHWQTMANGAEWNGAKPLELANYGQWRWNFKRRYYCARLAQLFYALMYGSKFRCHGNLKVPEAALYLADLSATGPAAIPAAAMVPPDVPLPVRLRTTFPFPGKPVPSSPMLDSSSLDILSW